MGDTFVVVTFDDLDGDCDLTDVGAIELYLPGNDALDAIMRSFQVVGIDDPMQPSASPTPLPSAAPSQEMCMCHCPIFTCALIFDPDDDENNAYYFDDDDEGQVIGSNGTINYYDFETESAGVMVQISTLVVVLVAAFVL